MLGKFGFLFLFIVAVAVVFTTISQNTKMTVVYEGNHDKKPIHIVLNHFQDSDCGMIIDDTTYASQVVSPGGKTWFFHDHGGMANWLKEKQFKDQAVIWTMTKDGKRWQNGKKLWYSRIDKTPMNYGFGAYEKYQDGFVDFETMLLFVARGEHLGNPLIKNQLLGDN